jgi:hypothetical protein
MAAAKQVQERIIKEREAINNASAHIAKLTDVRVQELEAGNDTRVDEIESEIRAAETAVARGEERLALLEQRLSDAQTEEAEAELDALAAQAAHARKVGERLILGDYTKAAAAVVTVLSKLKAVDDFISSVDDRLQQAGRQRIDTSNGVRCQARQVIKGTRTERIGAGDPRRPDHTDIEISHDGKSCRHRVTKQAIPMFADFDMPYTEIIQGYGQDPLQDSVRLPSVATDGTSYWPPLKAEDRSALLRQLGIGEPAGMIGKLKQIITPKAA